MHVKPSAVFALLQRTRGRVFQICSFVILISAAFTTVLAVAQTGQGSVTGQVTDPKGASVVGASVTILNKSTGIQNITRTDSAGVYNVINLIPGNYRVAMMAPGFKDLVTDDVIVSAGATVPLNGVLEVGRESQSVTVHADAELLSQTSDVSTTIDQQIVQNLPYPERSALEAVLLVPGVMGDTLNPGGIQPENPNAYTNYFVPGASISIGGAPPGTTSIIIDGSDVTEASYPRAGINLSGDMVQEATVITAGASAQYGRTGGGVIVEASRPGTSQYHGGASWRHTDPWFNAFPLGTTAKNDQHDTFIGGYFGGPVRIPKLYHGDSKTFFFGAYEPGRVRQALSFRGLLLTPAELAGNLHNSVDIMNQSLIKTSGWTAALAAPRTGGVGFDAPVGGNAQYALFPYGQVYSSSSSYQQATGPLSDCTGAGINQEDLPGATVCHDDLTALMKQNAFAQFVASQMPSPTNPGPYITFDSPDGAASTDLNNGTYKRGMVDVDNRWSVRVDHQFSNSDSIYTRYTYVPLNAARFFAVPQTNPLNQVPTDVENGRDVAVGWTHVVSNSMVNVAHYSWFREHLQRLPPLGLATSEDIGGKYGLTPAVLGYGMPTLGSMNSNGDSYAIQPANLSGSIQIDQNFIMGDDISYTRGAHQMTFGFDYRWIQSNQYDLSGVFGGKYGFSASQSQATNAQPTCSTCSPKQPVIGGGSAWGSFIEGIQSGSYSNTPVEVPGYYRYKYWATYFEDNWRITPQLTLNLGARYEVQVPRTEAKNNQAFVSGNSIPGTLNGIAATTAFCFSGACGLQRSLWPTNYWGLEPRVGFAYAPTTKTTIRSSFAITRQPLSGLENIPDPDFNVSGSSSGVVANYQQDYLTNPPAAASLVSSYTQLAGARGPFYFSTGLAPVFVSQSKAVPYTEIWNLSIQYQPLPKTLTMVTYQGLNGEHLYGPFVALNTPSVPSIVAAMNAGTYLGATSPNTYNILSSNNASGSVLTESNLQKLEPYQNFFNQSMNLIYPREGVSHYNALYFSVNQRATRYFTVLANYTWTKSIDDVPDTNSGYGAGSGTSAVQNPFNLRSEYSVSTFDQDSQFKAGYNVNMPFGVGAQWQTGNRLVDQLIGNISLGGVSTWVVGFPNYVTLGGNGTFYQYVPAGTPGCTASSGYCSTGVLPSGYTVRPNLVPGVPIKNPNWKQAPFAASGTTSYFNTTQVTNSNGNVIQVGAFAVPGSVNSPNLGNGPRTLPGARSPREFFTDMRFNKGFSVHERYKFNLNATFSNLFNHPVYYGISTHTPFASFSTNNTTGQTTNNVSGTFGNLSASNSQGISRIIQVGASINF